MTNKLPTSAACEVAGFDRQRLNEDISTGLYPFAPPAHRVTGRWWDEIDLCGLYVYAFLLRVYAPQVDGDVRPLHLKPGLHKRVVAVYAGEIVKALRSGLGDDQTRIDFPLSGFNDEWATNRSDQPPSFFVGDTGSDIATICFSLSGIRAAVKSRVARWSGE